MATRRQTGGVGTNIPGTNGRGMPLNFYQGQYEQLLNNVAIPNQNFDASATMPIPGLTGPVAGPGPQIPAGPGVMPNQPPPSMPPTFANAFQPNGLYGLLAQQLAGVGGPNMGIPQQPDAAQAMGLLGPKQPQRMWGGIGGK